MENTVDVNFGVNTVSKARMTTRAGRRGESLMNRNESISKGSSGR